MENPDFIQNPNPKKQDEAGIKERDLGSETLDLGGIDQEFEDLMKVVEPNQERIVQQLEADPDPEAKKKLKKYEGVF